MLATLLHVVNEVSSSEKWEGRYVSRHIDPGVNVKILKSLNFLGANTSVKPLSI